jgi:hypothetical protein
MARTPNRDRLYRQIGEFMFVFSQMEFALRLALARALNINVTSDAFDAVIGGFDFFRLCRVTERILLATPKPGRISDEKIRTIVANCMKVNDERNRVDYLHRYWLHARKIVQPRGFALPLRFSANGSRSASG